MKKEEIQDEYNQLMPALGQAVYHALLPWLNVLNMANRAAYLSSEMERITPKYQGPKIAEEKTEEKTDVVPEVKETNP